MLGILKKIFNKKENTTDSSIEFYDSEPTKNTNFLTNPIKVNNLLKRIEECSPLCSISMEGTTEAFSTSIIDVQIDKNCIIIDELFPEYGNELLIKKNKIKLSTRFNGIHLAFELRGIKPGSSRNIAYYKVTIPHRIYYPQRRSSPRIQIISLNTPFSGISSRSKDAVSGTTFDLSRTGIGISIPNNRARIQRGDLIKNCKIDLDDAILKFDLTIRFIKKTNKTTGSLLIGGYFGNISAKDQNKLEHYVASIERKEIRNQKDK